MSDPLDILLSPMSQETFLEDFFERKFLHLKGKPTDAFKPLFSRRCAETLMWSRREDVYEIADLIRNGRPHNPPQSANLLNSISQGFQSGDTIKLLWLEKHVAPIAEFHSRLMDVFDGQVHVNAYVTPPNASGLAAHYDNHDVFVAQVEGSKKWRLYDAFVDLPTPEMQIPVQEGKLGTPAKEVVLRAGEVLYLPRGIIHAAETTDETSIHLTVGLHPFRWLDYLKTAVEMAAESDALLRRSVQAGPAEDRQKSLNELVENLRRQISSLSFEDVMTRAARSRLKDLAPPPSEFLNIQWNPEDLDVEDFVVKTPGLTSTVESKGGMVGILYPGSRRCRPGESALQTMMGPQSIEPALRFIANSREPFQISALAGGLSDNAKLVLTRRLISDGVLMRQLNIN